MTMTYKEMAIEKLFRENVCDPDVSRVLLKLNDILKDVTFIDEKFLYERIKPVLSKKTLCFMRDNDGLFCAFNSDKGFELVSEQSIVNVFSRFIEGGKLTDVQINGLRVWTIKLIKPFAKAWKQRIVKVANDLKNGI